jgi:hypothetical protein
VTFAIALAGYLFVRRHGGGTALEELERANRVLERRVKDLELDNSRLTGEVATLNAQTNVSLAIACSQLSSSTRIGRASAPTGRSASSP